MQNRTVKNSFLAIKAYITSRLKCNNFHDRTIYHVSIYHLEEKDKVLQNVNCYDFHCKQCT